MQGCKSMLSIAEDDLAKLTIFRYWGDDLAKLIIFRYFLGCKLAIQLLALPVYRFTFLLSAGNLGFDKGKQQTGVWG